MNRNLLQFNIMRVLKERLPVFEKSLLRSFKILPFLIDVIWQIYDFHVSFLYFILTFAPNADTKSKLQRKVF